jgi:hypothetical protein
MNSDPKIEVLLSCYDALRNLEVEDQKYVIWQLANRLGPPKADQLTAKPNPPDKRILAEADETGDSSTATDEGFAEAFSKANPQTEDKKVLFTAWFLFGRKKPQDFKGLQITKRLQQTGHGVNSVSVCLGRLKQLKPSLVVQMGSTGNKKQSRKIYRLTEEGIRAAQQMQESPKK